MSAPAMNITITLYDPFYEPYVRLRQCYDFTLEA